MKKEWPGETGRNGLKIFLKEHSYFHISLSSHDILLRWPKVLILSIFDIFLIDNGTLADSSKFWPIPLSHSSKFRGIVQRNRPVQNPHFGPSKWYE